VFLLWSCQVIDGKRHFYKVYDISAEGWKERDAGFEVEAIVCANDDCKELNLSLGLYRHEGVFSSGNWKNPSIVNEWGLLPASSAKPQPDYIPEPLRRDYEEACAIRDLSPKASATITRRCIQGIIRDFCEITTRRGRLIDEIDELRRQVNAGKAPPGVQPDTVAAIDHVRQIRNIGAHMEADINVIVEVDPKEAQLLIELTEILFEEWYVAREQRKQRLAEIGFVAEDKKLIQRQRRLPPPEASQTEVTAEDP